MSDAPDYTQDYLDRGEDRIGLHNYPAPGDPDAPLIVVWPAMGTPARFYRPLARRLGESGAEVVVVDLRGTGSSTPRPSRRSAYGYADLAGDVGAVLDHLKSRVDGRKTYLLGHSLGGQVCAIHLATTQDSTVDGLILVAVGLPWYRTYPGARALGVLGFTQWISATSALLRVWPGWGFGGRQARRVMTDWGYTARRGRFPRHVGATIEQDLARVRHPVLAVSVDRDQFTPAPTMDHLCGKFASAPVERVHLDTGLDHFTWVRSSEQVVEKIAAWLPFATRPA